MYINVYFLSFGAGGYSMFFENMLIHPLIFCFLCWFEYTDVGNVKIRGPYKKSIRFRWMPILQTHLTLGGDILVFRRLQNTGDGRIDVGEHGNPFSSHVWL